MFGSLLDREAGFFRLGPFGISHPTARSYEAGTNVLTTTWSTPSGWIVLTQDGFVLRYRTGETDDGLSGEEGTFLICSFWLVSALAIVGELLRAHDLLERLLGIASPLGLYAEEYDPRGGRQLGNFPQAFSHLALIEAAARIVVPETLQDY